MSAYLLAICVLSVLQELMPQHGLLYVYLALPVHLLHSMELENASYVRLGFINRHRIRFSAQNVVRDTSPELLEVYLDQVV